MTTLAAREAKNGFGRLLDTAQREPVTITKMRRPVAVLLSKHEYDLLQSELQDLRSERETARLMEGENGRRLQAALAVPPEARVVKTFDELEAEVQNAAD